MKIEKKYVVAGALCLISIALGAAYLQYRKMMNYTIKFYNLKINSISMSLVNFDLFLNFTNNSNVQIDILEQDYKVYINGKLVTTAVNHETNTIYAVNDKDGRPNKSILGVNIQFNPSSVMKLLSENASDMVLHPEKINITADIKLKVKLFGFKVSIPYMYQATLKDINDSRKASKLAAKTNT